MEGARITQEVEQAQVGVELRRFSIRRQLFEKNNGEILTIMRADN